MLCPPAIKDWLGLVSTNVETPCQYGRCSTLALSTVRWGVYHIEKFLLPKNSKGVVMQHFGRDWLRKNRLLSEIFGAVYQYHLGASSECTSSKQIGHKRPENKGDISDVFTLNRVQRANTVHDGVEGSAA